MGEDTGAPGDDHAPPRIDGEFSWHFVADDWRRIHFSSQRAMDAPVIPAAAWRASMAQQLGHDEDEDGDAEASASEHVKHGVTGGGKHGWQ
jgi:hypothetical protein